MEEPKQMTMDELMRDAYALMASWQVSNLDNPVNINLETISKLELYRITSKLFNVVVSTLDEVIDTDDIVGFLALGIQLQESCKLINPE